MPAISASAPGKIILFGEHAVVYGRPAIAVPVVQVRAKALIKPDLSGPRGQIWIRAPEANIDSPLSTLPEGDPIARAVLITLEALTISQAPAFQLRLTSTIPIAAGLGSGAAVSVAIIRGVSAFLGHPLPDNRVSALAFEIEKIHHGTPSGIDNTVITYARPVVYIREQPIQTLTIGQPIQFIIADTGITSPTAVTVGEVRKKWENDRAWAERIFDAIGSLTQDARQAIEAGDQNNLGTLMDQNHRLLQELDVSSPELDRLVDAARAAGGLGAKLSGGGRGGNIIVQAPTGMEENITAALQSAGAVRTFSTVVRNPDGEN